MRPSSPAGAPSRTTAASPVPRLPLSLRLPNPDPTFVGHGETLATLHTLLQDHPVVVLTGPAGIGKSTLATEALQRRPPHAGPLARLPLATLPPGTLQHTLRRTLALGDAIPPDWRLLDPLPEEALAALVDLADAGPWTLLLDDADHHPQPDELLDILLVAARWSRHARWILTLRTLPDELRGHVASLPVPPLQPHDIPPWLDRMTRAGHDTTALAPLDPDTLHHTTGGRPAALRALLATPDTPDHPDVSRVRALLLPLRRPLRHNALRALDIQPDHPALKHLESTGRLQRLPEGFLLRDHPDDPATPAPDPHAIAERIEDVPEDNARIEALRLWLEHHRLDRATALLQRHGDELCEHGHAADLWLLLDAATRHADTNHDPALRDLADWKAWCGWEWGSPQAVANIEDTPQDSWRGAMLHARIRLNRGELPDAVRLCRDAALLADSDRDHDTSILFAARALYSLGRPHDTLALLPLCRSDHPRNRIEREVLRAECIGLDDRAERITDAVETLLEHADDLGPTARLRAFLGLARLHLLRQRLRDAERVIDSLLRVGAERIADSVGGRTAIELAAMIAINRGQFDRLRQLAARLENVRGPRVRRLFIDCYLTAAAQWQEPPEHLTRRIEQLAREADAEGEGMAADVRCYADAVRARHAARHGIAPHDLPALPTDRQPTPIVRVSRDLARACLAAAHGQTPALPPIRDQDWPEHRALALEARATSALHRAVLADPPDPAALAEAIDLLDQGLTIAHETGYSLFLLDLLPLRIITALLRPDPGAARERLRALDDIARQHPLPRLDELRQLLHALASEHGPHPAALEALVHAHDTHPTVRRWSLWLLGESPRLSPLEAGLLPHLARRVHWTRPILTGDPAATGTARPGLDLQRALLWSPEGLTLDLARHGTLLRVLAALANRGGTADKESLITAAWDITDYHPLHHDNRLRLATRKIRRLCEDAGLPQPIDTLEDGYALRGPWRWIPA